MPKIDHDYAEVNGVRLHYAKCGSGRPIVFLHGFPEFWFAWGDLIKHFASQGWLAVAPDQRGYNLSSKPEAVEQYRTKHLVEDLRQFVGNLTQEKIVLVAHDWGGAVAWSFAMAYPKLLSHLVIINSPHPYTFWRELRSNPAQRQASQYMLMLRSPKAEMVLTEKGFERLWRVMTGDWNGVLPASLDHDTYVRAWGQPGALTGALNWYRASPLYPPSAQDAGPEAFELDPDDFMVRVPTLVIWGERERALLPGCLDGLEICVPKLKIVRVPEGSHWIVHELPDRVTEEIKRFTTPGRR